MWLLLWKKTKMLLFALKNVKSWLFLWVGWGMFFRIGAPFHFLPTKSVHRISKSVHRISKSVHRFALDEREKVEAGGPEKFLQFSSIFLNIIDMVVLSGAHTIGRTSCASIQDRIYNFKGTGKPDPTIDPKYLNFLQRKCRWASEYVNLDATTPNTFVPIYFLNLQKNMGLLSTDQLLYSDLVFVPISLWFRSDSNEFDVDFAKRRNLRCDFNGFHWCLQLSHFLLD